MKELQEMVDRRIARDMREAETWTDCGELPWWDVCYCDSSGEIGAHRRYTGYCRGHNASDCLGAILVPDSDHGDGGWYHHERCDALTAGFRRAYCLDNLRGAAWIDLRDSTVSWHDPLYDPNTCDFKDRPCTSLRS